MTTGLEIAVLKGDMGDVQHFADDVIFQRGVRHGHLQCLPKEEYPPVCCAGWRLRIIRPTRYRL